MAVLGVIAQTIFLIILSPLVSGFIRKIKNNIRMRKGAVVLQPYYNFFKLLSKDEVISENSSWIFRFSPFIVLASSITALLLMPVFNGGISLNYMGDVLVLIFLLALGRFFLALAGLDTASAFGGMGSSREMFISSLVEPVMLVALFVVSLNCGSTSLAVISSASIFKLSTLVAALALLMVTITETSRIPVDNQETHLELTMIHEAMLLEYSGRSLALIELAAHIKQLIFYSLLANILLPLNSGYFNTGLSGIFIALGLYLIKVFLIGASIAIIEVSMAKMRLFRVVDFLGFSFVLSILAVVLQTVGF
jgi:formate hydrogenlyase subunit 4